MNTPDSGEDFILIFQKHLSHHPKVVGELLKDIQANLCKAHALLKVAVGQSINRSSMSIEYHYLSATNDYIESAIANFNDIFIENDE